MNKEPIVPKRRHIKFRRRGIAQKKAYYCIFVIFHYVLNKLVSMLHGDGGWLSKHVGGIKKLCVLYVRIVVS